METIIKLIKQINGSIIPAEFNQAAFELFIDLEKPEPECDMVKEVKQSGFYATTLFERYMDSAFKWRRLIWCYQKAAFLAMFGKGFIPLLKHTPSSFSMGLMRSPERTELPIYDDGKKVWIDSIIDKDYWESTKKEGDTIRSIKTKISPDRSTWQQSAIEVLRPIFNNWSFISFEPSIMGETEEGYLSFIYSIRVGKTKFVFHTTERGFDVFSSIRNELSKVMPKFSKEILGEYYGMYNI